MKQDLRYPVNFSNGEWKYTPVVNIPTNQIATRTILNATAEACASDHVLAHRDTLIWSTKNRADMVRRKTWPETSCPFLRRGSTGNLSSGVHNEDSANDPINKNGCVSCEMAVRVRQYSYGTVNTAPDWRVAVHSPPEATVSLSSRAGPKNQLVNTSHTAVSTPHLTTLCTVRLCGGLVSQRVRKAAEVQPQARLMKYEFRILPLFAK